MEAMTERKPPGMSFETWVEQQISRGLERGDFDNLPGAGKPQHLDPGPADEDARAMWWALRILRNADVETDEIRYRKRISALREHIAAAEEEPTLVALVREHNQYVRRLNTMGTNVIRSTFGPLDEAAELGRLRDRQASER